MKRVRLSILSIILVFSLTSIVSAQESFLDDKTGDGKVIINAFGDSITYGVGDGVPSFEVADPLPTTDGSQGYPARIEKYLNTLVDNEGRPGEMFESSGIFRLPSSLIGTSADIILFMEGANDAFFGFQANDYENLAQKAINATRALGRTPVLVTLPVFCCSHQQIPPFTNRYSDVLRKLSGVNNIPVADVQRAWTNRCPNPSDCDLMNIPEGLHPNTKGYDLIAQTITATLLGIDVFKPTGPEDLASAIGVDISEIVVVPDPTSSTVTE